MRKLLIIDNNTLSRESIVNIVYCIENETVVYEAEILEHASSLNVTFNSEDIVVFKDVYHQQDQYDDFNKLNHQFPLTKKLIISHSNNQQYFRTLLEHGADGVLNISCSRNELIAALRSIKAGDKFLSRAATDSDSNFTSTRDPEKKSKMKLSLVKKQDGVRKIDFDYQAMCFANNLFNYEKGLSEGTIIPDGLSESCQTKNQKI